ncbi:hypothetical protein HY251_11465 [bacterium]|nr:hypothetical protein [bacterium]
MQLKERWERGDRPRLLDVRLSWETEIAKLEGAVHVPMHEIVSRADELDPEQEIVVYCHHGIRSAGVVGFLLSKGFKDVKNLSGGLALWAERVDLSMARY